MRVFNAIVFPIIGIIVCVMCFQSAELISESAGAISRLGAEISDIRSQGGRTLEEAYYREWGRIIMRSAGILNAIGEIVKAIGVFLASVLVWLGLRK